MYCTVYSFFEQLDFLIYFFFTLAHLIIHGIKKWKQLEKRKIALVFVAVVIIINPHCDFHQQNDNDND